MMMAAGKSRGLAPWQGKGEVTRRWVILCWLVLFAYRVLRPLVGQGRAISFLRGVLSRPFKRRITEYMAERFGISQDAPEDAFDCVSQNFKLRGEQLYGPGWTYIQAVQDHRQSHIHITRCLFNDFYRAHDAPELTALFCTLDGVWIEEIHQERYKTRFERPTTLANGDDACRFRFSRVEDGANPARPTVASDSA
jgi:L-2-amino-thiazoline-4-carboxylic acid hydrolase